MGIVRAVVAGMVALMAWAAVASGSPRQTADDENALQLFQSAVEAYVALHEAAELTVPPLEISPDFEEIFAASERMARAIRAVRPSAKEGDIFGAQGAPILRLRIRERLREPGCTVADILASERDEDLFLPRPLRPLVHDSFDWGSGSFMPWCVLEVLPLLPEDLQFRFVDRDLVLIDLSADLVVDVLPDALPSSPLWKGARYARH